MGLILPLSLKTQSTWRSGAGGGGAYRASAVHFDGTSLLKRTGLIGTPGPKFTASGWMRSQYDGNTSRTFITLFQANGTDTGAQGIGGSTVFVDTGVTKDLLVSALETTEFESPGVPYGAGWSWFKSSLGFQNDVWYHFLVSVDTSVTPAIKKFYLNGVSVALDLNFNDGLPVPMTLDFFNRTFYVNDWKIAGGTQPAIQDMADVWISTEFLDIDDAAVRAKFIAAGKPVSLGSTGQLPSGRTPEICFSGDASGFVTNRGTGGAFTLVGSVTDVGSSPSD